MKRKDFLKKVKQYGFMKFRDNGKHLILSRGKERFAVPRGGNKVKISIIWRFQRDFNIQLLRY